MPAALLGFDKKPIYVPKSIKFQKTPKKSHTERVTEDASLSLTITNAPHSNLATTERSAITLLCEKMESLSAHHPPHTEPWTSSGNRMNDKGEKVIQRGNFKAGSGWMRNGRDGFSSTVVRPLRPQGLPHAMLLFFHPSERTAGAGSRLPELQSEVLLHLLQFGMRPIGHWRFVTFRGALDASQLCGTALHSDVTRFVRLIKSFSSGFGGGALVANLG